MVYTSHGNNDSRAICWNRIASALRSSRRIKYRLVKNLEWNFPICFDGFVISSVSPVKGYLGNIFDESLRIGYYWLQLLLKKALFFIYFFIFYLFFIFLLYFA